MREVINFEAILDPSPLCRNTTAFLSRFLGMWNASTNRVYARALMIVGVVTLEPHLREKFLNQVHLIAFSKVRVSKATSHETLYQG